MTVFTVYPFVQQLKFFLSSKYLFCLFLFTGILCAGPLSAQNADSLRQERLKIAEAERAARMKSLDSMRMVRQHQADSMKSVRQRISDSLAAIRQYRESKRYKDSVAAVRQKRTDSLNAERTAYYDSLKKERLRVQDSIMAIRKATMDSLTAIRKKRSDSLAVIRQYRESKRYKDSVAFTRQQHLDSIRNARKEINDSMMAVRIKERDSAILVRKRYNDSLTSARKKITDSISGVRKKRTDSLTKVREEKEKMRKTQEKKREEQKQLGLELKIKKKREAWNNEKMRKRKWTLLRRTYHNTVTRYNYYFNADRKMDEAIDNMLRMRQESYDSLITLFPFNPDTDSTLLSSDMDSIIQKTSLGIQIHDPRTIWADDLYLLLGQAYYYKGNYTEASTAFRYIISMNQQRKKEELRNAANKKGVDKTVTVLDKEEKKPLDFLRHKSSNNEAVLWLARTYTQSGKTSDAISILDLLESDKNMSEELKGRLALEKAYVSLSDNDLRAAPDYLSVVAEDESMPKWIRLRASFLNGQLLYHQRAYEKAAESFQQSIDMNPPIEMDFYARKNMAYCHMAGGSDKENSIAMLEKILRDGKYASFHEQVYYVLGRLSEGNGKTEEAIGWLNKSVQSPKSTKKQKAISFAALGNAYYNTANFKMAKVAYDSAAFYARHAPADADIELAVRRAETVDKIVLPQEVIVQQDSLLALADMTEKEQRAAARHYIRMLEKKISDSISRAEIADAEGGITMEVMPEAGSALGSFTNWYFSNPSLLKQGYSDFKKKWGNRPDTDNWRIAGGKNKSSSRDTERATQEEDTDENGLPTEEALLAFIPRTAEEKDTAFARMQRAYLALANAYIQDLEDYPGGIRTVDTFEKRFPAHVHKGEILYLRYLAAMGQNQLEQAQAFSEAIRKSYPASSWASAVAPSEVSETGKSQVSVVNYYDETYGLMMQRDYTSVLKRARQGMQQYKDPVYQSRFRIMEAIALAGSGAYEQADTLLTSFITSRGGDSLRTWAQTILDYVKKNKPVAVPVDSTATAPPSGVPPAAASDASVPAGTVPVDTATVLNDTPPAPAVYTYQPNQEHYFLFYFKKAESRAMGVRAALRDFNALKFSGQNLTLRLEMLREDQGVIVVQTFSSAAHARIYLNAVKANNLIFKEYTKQEYVLMSISADNFRKLMIDKDVEPYVIFHNSKYK